MYRQCCGAIIKDKPSILIYIKLYDQKEMGFGSSFVLLCEIFDYTVERSSCVKNIFKTSLVLKMCKLSIEHPKMSYQNIIDGLNPDIQKQMFRSTTNRELD